KKSIFLCEQALIFTAGLRAMRRANRIRELNVNKEVVSEWTRKVAAWQVVLASVLMVATLPGRTQGLGLVTEPLLADLHLNRVTYATMNLWATVLGALLC